MDSGKVAGILEAGMFPYFAYKSLHNKDDAYKALNNKDIAYKALNNKVSLYKALNNMDSPAAILRPPSPHHRFC